MQLNCKVIKKWQPPISASKPPFQGYPPFLLKFLVPPLPQVTQFLEGLRRSYPPPPHPFNKGAGGSNYDLKMAELTLLDMIIDKWCLEILKINTYKRWSSCFDEFKIVKRD